ncbi:hypothetical protein AAG906_037773 [Vitis piasezkii]
MGEQTQTQTTQPPSSLPENPSPAKSRKLSSHSSPRTAAIFLPITRLLSSDDVVAAALRHLRRSDPVLAPVIDAYEPPKLRIRTPVSGFSEEHFIPANYAQGRHHHLQPLCVALRRETRVCPISLLHDLANKYRTGILSDSKILKMEDRALVSLIAMVKGFGVLSVHMFMIFSLHRPDVLPVGDANLRKGVQMLYGLEELPRPSQMEKLCERWRPYRSVASWYIWRLSSEANGVQGKAESGETGAGSPKGPATT